METKQDLLETLLADPAAITAESLADLSVEELADLEHRSADSVRALAEDNEGDLEQARAFAGVVKLVREENGRRSQAAQERAEAAASLLAEIEPPAAETDPDEVPAETEEEETIPEPAPEPTDEVTDPEPVVEAPKAVAAAAPTLRQIAAKVPASRRPQRPTKPLVTITAGGDVKGFSAGQRFRSLREVGEAMAGKIDGLQGTRKPTGPLSVARFEFPYPEDRALTASTEENTRRIEAVASQEAIRERYLSYGGDLAALTAAGGLCAPTETRYALETIGVTDRPVRDALPSFQADRGGVRYIRPPAISTLTGSDGAIPAGSGVDVITEQEDTDSTTKTVYAITCGTVQEDLVDAIYLYLQVGEFNRRFYPEQFAAWNRLGLTRHARVAESRLLERIAAGSTAITDGVNTGAARDLLESYTRFAARYRSSHRLSPTFPFTVLLPFWVQDMISADLLRQGPGDSTMAVTRGEVDRFFAAHNLDVHWYLDDETGAATSMIYVDEGGGAGNPWITSVIGYMFPAGTWIFLDGGELNLGVEVRDSTLISQNNVQAFYESFEGAARVGHQSLKITNTVCVSGEASALIDFTCPGSGS